MSLACWVFSSSIFGGACFVKHENISDIQRFNLVYKRPGDRQRGSEVRLFACSAGCGRQAARLDSAGFWFGNVRCSASPVGVEIGKCVVG